MLDQTVLSVGLRHATRRDIKAKNTRHELWAGCLGGKWEKAVECLFSLC